MEKTILVLVAGCALAMVVGSSAFAAEIVGIGANANGRPVSGAKVSVADQTGRIENQGLAILCKIAE